MTDVTSAEFLDRVAKRTPLFARFSTTAGEKGSPETVRDVRGFAFKLYTPEGNLDWIFLSQVNKPSHKICYGIAILTILEACVLDSRRHQVPLFRPCYQEEPSEWPA